MYVRDEMHRPNNKSPGVSATIKSDLTEIIILPFCINNSFNDIASGFWNSFWPNQLVESS